MMSSLDLPTLEERRNKSKITTMYKIINGNLSIPTNELIPNHCPSREGYYKQLDTMIDSYKFFFLFPFCNQTLEHTPPFVIHSPTLDELCTNLNIHYDHTCAQQSLISANFKVPNREVHKIIHFQPPAY